jgi:hypothetical protein
MWHGLTGHLVGSLAALTMIQVSDGCGCTAELVIG